MITVTDDSFLYNGVDMAQAYRLYIISYDVLSPPLRERRVAIPMRSGSIDYGANYHDDRTLRMECTIEGELSAAKFDDLKYTLSRKGRIVVWDKPDRYYYGRLYESPEVLDYQQLSMRDFELSFLCQPYALAHDPTIITSNAATIDTRDAYAGTRTAPTRITIHNLSDEPLRGVTITARARAT